MNPSSEVIFRDATGGVSTLWFYGFLGSVLVFFAFVLFTKVFLEHLKAYLKGGVKLADLARLFFSSLAIISFVILLAT